MQRISQLWKSGIAGKLVIGCGGFAGLLFVCALCGVLVGEGPAGRATPTLDVSAVQTQAAQDFVATLTAEAPSPSATPTPTVPSVKTPLPPTPTPVPPTPTRVPPSPTPVLPIPTATPPPPTPTPTLAAETAQVVKIVDGDTIDVQISGQTFRVRYIGMNTSETGQPCAAEATNYNAELVRGKTVTLVKDISETDRYGRLLRYVYVGDIFVNAELVRQGYANAATYPPDVAYADLFVELEAEARAAGLGCWAAPATPTSGAGWNCIGNIYNCSDFSSCAQVMSYWHACPGDPSRLDGDYDGIPCESLCR